MEKTSEKSSKMAKTERPEWGARDREMVREKQIEEIDQGI